MDLSEARRIIAYIDTAVNLPLDNEDHWLERTDLFHKYFDNTSVTPELIDLLVESFVSNDRNNNALAHIFQDKIYELVLDAIANDRCLDEKRCAASALKCKNIAFQRWYA